MDSKLSRIALGSALALVFPTLSLADNRTDPIRIVTNNWTSQLVLSRVTGAVFSEMGYRVDYVPVSTSEQWGALSHGIAHVQVEVWEGTMADMLQRMVSEGGMVEMGTHSAKTREEWWYPSYVEQHCPGLPDWRALKDCAPAFATDFSGTAGTYYSGPWEKPDEARVRALGLNFKVKVLANGDDLWVELKQAMADKKPIVLFNWTPNWVESRYDGRFVEFPAYAPACETDPSWGINKDYIHDCGNPTGGWLKKAAWSGMEQSWPCAAQALRNIDFSNAQIAAAASLVDVDQLSVERAAEVWLQDNAAVWRSWIPQHCRQTKEGA